MAWSLIEQIEQHEGPLGAATLARFFGCSKKTIYEMMAREEIPTITLPGDHRSKIADPKTLLYVLRRKNPMMREAEKARG